MMLGIMFLVVGAFYVLSGTVSNFEMWLNVKYSDHGVC